MTGDAVDSEIRELLGAAGSDAPPAPSIDEIRASVPNASRAPWRRLVTGIAGLAAAAAAVGVFVVANDSGSDRLVPGEQPPASQPTVDTSVTGTSGDPADGDDQTGDPSGDASEQVTTVASTAATETTTAPPDAAAEPVLATEQDLRTAPGDIELASPLLDLWSSPIDPLLDGHWLDYAATIRVADGWERVARYRTEPDTHALTLRIASGVASDGVRNEPVATIDGRPVAVVGADCSPGSCAVELAWDGRSTVTAVVEGGSAEPLDLLLAAVERLVDEPPVRFPVAAAEGPGLSESVVVIAGQDGVVVDDGWRVEPLDVFGPAWKAVGLPDGRLLVASTIAAEPGGLTLVTVAHDGVVASVDFWPSQYDEPDVAIEVEDAVTIAGEPHLLLQVTRGPCDEVCERTGSLDLVPLYDDGQPPTTLVEYGSVNLGFNPEGYVEADIGTRGDTVDVVGVEFAGFDASAIVATVDDDGIVREAEPSFQSFEGTDEGDARLGLTVDDVDGYLVVASPAEQTVEVRDRVGDLDVVIPLADRGRYPFVQSSLRRTATGAAGTIWLRDLDTAIEVDLGGNILRQFDAPGLANITTRNR